jgi:endoglucanase
MEMGYPAAWYSVASGPVAGTNYPVLKEALIDYFAAKKVGAIRFLVSWEALQPKLGDPIPNASAAANYRTYYGNYKRIVDYATGKGIQVIIEPWEADASDSACGGCWNGNKIGSAAVPISAFADFWGKMAAVFMGNPRVSYGLINEPNNQSTMTWFRAAQAAISAIRDAGSTQRIFVPGNCWTAASDWTATWCDTDSTKVSNATAWLTVNGGQPLYDPLNNIAIEVHTYLDSDQGGSSTVITSVNAAQTQIATTLNWAKARGLKVYLGEIGFYAGATSNDGHPAADAWANFIGYFKANPDSFAGFTWWAAGDPSWWSDVAANGGGHFSVSPKTCGASSCSGDTINMQMIQGSF